MQTPYGGEKNIEEFKISHMDYFSYLKEDRNALEILKKGISGSTLFGKLRNPEYIHRLYLQRDPSYMQYLHDFKEKYKDYEGIADKPIKQLIFQQNI